MSKYVGQPCTSCRSLIKEDDKVVVCPICGSPYHKDCYAAEGSCINTVLHEKGESWQPETPSREFIEEHPDADPEREGEPVGTVCPRCGLTNQPGSVFCSQCGMPIDMQRATQSGGFGAFNPFANMKREDPNLDGVQLSDYGNYIGSNQFYYLPKFLNFAKTKTKFGFNLSAFFIPNLYFFYRKMILIGIAVMVLSTVLSIPGVVIALSDGGLLAVPVTEKLIIVNNICAVLSYVIRFICGFFGNYFYFSKAKKEILKIKESTPEEGEATLRIRRTGGTNVLYCLIGFGIEMAISFIIVSLLVPMM